MVYPRSGPTDPGALRIAVGSVPQDVTHGRAQIYKDGFGGDPQFFKSPLSLIFWPAHEVLLASKNAL